MIINDLPPPPPPICNNSNRLDLTSEKPHLTYRSDIDGLRAFAVLSVIIFHAFPRFLPGGFIGVDIFFVISGYLIGGIIFKSLRAKSFSFRDFYARRARRIFPALLVVLLFALTFGYFTMLPAEYKQLGRHIRDSVSFIQNFRLLREVGYWDISAQFKPLLHLWSLAIEEQFYLAFPLLIFTAWKIGLRLGLVIGAILAASFLLGLKPETSDFYLPQTRVWELLIGALLWEIMNGGDQQINALKKLLSAIFTRAADKKYHREWFAVGGAILIVAGWILLRGENKYPGLPALLPTLGAAALIAANGSWINRRVLSNPVSVAIGKISYPLYLWHWVLLSFGFIFTVGTPGENRWQWRATIIAIAILLAIITYFAVEKPVRFGKHWRTGKLIFLLIAMAAVYGMGWLAKAGTCSIFNRDQSQFFFDEGVNKWQAAICKLFPTYTVKNWLDGKIYYREVSSDNDGTLLIGDSHMGHYAARINYLIEHFSADQVNNILGIFNDRERWNKFWNSWSNDSDLQSTLTRALENWRVKKVVFSQIWRGDGKVQGLYDFVEYCRQKGIAVYFIANNPMDYMLNPESSIIRNLRDFPYIIRQSTDKSTMKRGISRQQWNQRSAAVTNDLLKIAKATGAIVIQPADYLCDDQWCDAVDKKGEAIYFDNDHLQADFVRENATWIDETVMAGK